MDPKAIPIDFSSGVDTKTDPWQLPVGRFQSLVNTVFTTGKRLTKRHGYGTLINAPPSSNYLTTLNGELTSLGTQVNAYVPTLNLWVQKGNIQPCSLSVTPLIRNSFDQTQSDSVTANGMTLITYTQVQDSTTSYLYSVVDSSTGQTIIQPTSIPVISGGTIASGHRSFVVGNYFVIAGAVTVSGSQSLQYVSLPTANPFNVSVAQKITSDVYVSNGTVPSWDGISNAAVNSLVVVYNTTTGGQGVHLAALSVNQIANQQSTTLIKSYTNAAYVAYTITVSQDLSVTPNIIYCTFWNNSTTNGYTFAVFLGLGTITQQFAPVESIVGIAVDNITSSANAGMTNIFFEVGQGYGYDTGIPSNYINTVAVTSAGTVGSTATSIRSVGLASKAFIISSTIYFLAAYESLYQSTYFLINGSTSTEANPVIVSKLAYQTGAGYSTTGLPSVSLSSNVANISYLYTDLAQPITSNNGTNQTVQAAVYTQTGINQANFTLGTELIDSAEIAGSLQFSGGYLTQYDGAQTVEQNFFLFPDSVESTWSATGGSIAAVPAGGTTGGINYYVSCCYAWVDMQGLTHRSAPSIPTPVTTSGTGTTGSITTNVPTIRLTGKTVNKATIEVYRWSVLTQEYNLVSSTAMPVVNDTTVDYETFVDTQADSSIEGNLVLYTTGGIVADTNGPASNIMCLFDTRLWQLDAENPNKLWISKQVIPNTPVEMSTLFTIYVPPTVGTDQSLGPVTGMFPMDDKIILFFGTGIQYINGVGPDNTGSTSAGCSLGNYSQPTLISGTVGCHNQDSIVLTPNGLMFESDKGLWLLGRDLSTKYLGDAVEGFNGDMVTSSVCIPETNYCLFTLAGGGVLMYDTYYNQWGTFQGVNVVSSCLYNGQHAILDVYGRVGVTSANNYLDFGSPVLLSLTTGWLNLAGILGYQRFYEFLLQANYLSPHKLQILVGYDYNSSSLSGGIASVNNYSGSTPSSFGSPVPVGGPSSPYDIRVHTKKQLCRSFQITINELWDSTLGNPVPGAGVTISNITCYVGIERNKAPVKAQNAIGLN